MSVRTKMPPTDAQCTLAFLGPAAQAEAARAALQALGFRALEGDAPPEKTARPAPRTSKAGRFLRGPLDGMPPLRHAHGVEGDTTTSLPVPWREAFLPLEDAERPGRMLRAARTKEDLSQMQLAARTGIPQRHLSEMEQGKRAIGKERAKKLAAALQVDYRVLL
jgi:hypothetical protein